MGTSPRATCKEQNGFFVCMCKLEAGVHLRYTHQRWHDAVHVGTAVGQRLFLIGLPVDCLQGLIKGLELEGSLLLSQLHIIQVLSAL